MEKYFKPVHNPSAADEIKPWKNHHHRDNQSHRYTKLDDSDRNTDDHQHSHFLHDSHHHDSHYPHQFHHSEEDEILYDHDTPVTLSRASSSSLSSSSSSSSTSWYTETSTNDPFTLRHAERPLHSLSCSNIPDVRGGFRQDESSEPIVFATVKHGKKGSICSESHESPQRRVQQDFTALDRGHSRSDEGYLQCNEVGRARSRASHLSNGPLYKTASLNRSLAFSEEDILLGVSAGPKRAVSSSQLPSKGILKNKELQTDIRKAKSMEVLSPRVPKGQNQNGQKGKGITPAEIEQAKKNFVEGKVQFSAFLDEITKQVISPSALSVLGVNNNKITGKTSTLNPKSEPVRPQLPPKKQRERTANVTEHHPKEPKRQEKACRGTRKLSNCSNPENLMSYLGRDHFGSPPPHHYPRSGHSSHHGGNRKDKKSSLSGSKSGDRHSRCGPNLTDGTSTSPESVQPKQRHHRKQQPSTIHGQQHYPQHVHPGSEHRGPNSHPSSAQSAGQGVGSESSSTKSDSSRARDTASTATSHSSEQSGRYQSQHVEHPQQHRDLLCDADHLQALQDENADLHQNLLQTVVCIESLETELQRTRDELSHVKDKYKSLLQTHTGTKQANNLLGEHLHIASESLSSERKYLQNRVSQLSSELEDAHRTISALENINVPCLIKDLLEKHFDSAEAIQKFLTTPVPTNTLPPVPRADGQSLPAKQAQDWLTETVAAPQRVTAFTPFKQPTTGSEGSFSGQQDLSHSPPFSVADISAAIYKKMAASYAARPPPLYPQSQMQQQQLFMSTNQAETSPDPRQVHVEGDGWGGKEGVKVMLLEKDADDVNSVSAQQILDDFLQQLQAHKEAAGRKEQRSGQEWVSGVEQAGKVTD